MYILCIYKNTIILSLLKIDTLNFTMYILTILICSLKIYVIGLHNLISMKKFFTIKDCSFSSRFETQVQKCVGVRFQVSGAQVSGARCQVLGVQVSGANFKIPEICKILNFSELILNNSLTNIYVGNLQYPSLKISIF